MSHDSLGKPPDPARRGWYNPARSRRCSGAAGDWVAGQQQPQRPRARHARGHRHGRCGGEHAARKPRHAAMTLAAMREAGFLHRPGSAAARCAARARRARAHRRCSSPCQSRAPRRPSRPLRLSCCSSHTHRPMYRRPISACMHHHSSMRGRLPPGGAHAPWHRGSQ